eukprot:scaffold8709_cov62-Phaeocystis_antarctica.AAC.5
MRISRSDLRAPSDGLREKTLPLASGMVSASVTKRKTSSLLTSPQTDCSTAPTARPPPLAPSSTSAPVRITVYTIPACLSCSSIAGDVVPSSVISRKTRVTPAALAALSCAGSAASSALMASHASAELTASVPSTAPSAHISPSEYWSTPDKPE